ncbi:carbohydrate ABC transporter permease [Lacticaseibacillus paracasei]|uniref:Carbohydrate ABC transporter permease n=2 Tax=Lacticaseibacillus paracasei TaxID=1597 RepID=A0ABD5D0L9_LACPA|nr:carbohydrate ABC transporter permease [Lacticaseibacillus paracasei]EPC69275.1 sugar ABC transporter permease [Lacticaseibacillus paracasei subsp. paracasei Lpp14]MDR7625277.1 carbohydrate ABC transporter permease [Lacticaseibacillus paracasei]QPC13114.1 carbohydrate ABC transporter permease [Lacticaseibacillus paracasei subsp. tolerans]QPC20375.1 carbohydrate ABC transporter permease [Lacticaseibacillus paracasei subsp. tolerans]QUS98396.1 carbohydrate ABC transporter permease [Lacticaseib
MSKLYDRTTKTLLTLALAIVCVLYLFPILWFLLSSLKPGNELFSYPLTIFPKHATFENFSNAWNTLDFFKYFKNTFISATITTVLTVLASATCGYALAKYDRKWLKIFFVCIIATTMLPTEVIMNPTFSVIKATGLYNRLAGIIIPSINTATGIFMFRSFFVTVPDSLIESARIDGASDGRIFASIMFPIARPIVMTLSIFSFQWRWNDYIWPLIVLNDPDKYTLQVALRSIIGAQNVNWSLLLASSVISILPLVLVFVVFQRYIMNSGSTSGMKD